MDWHYILFAAKWVMIALVYVVLLIFLVGVYREMTLHLRKGSPTAAVVYGQLKVLHTGADPDAKVGALIPLKTETRLGAQRDNDIVLKDPFVSHHHARLRWDGAVWWIEDLNSKNGTLVDRQRCIPGRPQSLPIGANIALGDMVFELLD